MEHTAGQIHHSATDSGSVELCMFSLPPTPPCLCGFFSGFSFSRSDAHSAVQGIETVSVGPGG